MQCLPPPPTAPLHSLCTRSVGEQNSNKPLHCTHLHLHLAHTQGCGFEGDDHVDGATWWDDALQGCDAEVWVGLDHLHIEPELDGDVAGEGDAAGNRLSDEAVSEVDSAQSRGREPEYAVKWFGTLSEANWHGTHARELQGAVGVFAALVVPMAHVVPMANVPCMAVARVRASTHELARKWEETCPTLPGTGSR